MGDSFIWWCHRFSDKGGEAILETSNVLLVEEVLSLR